MRFVRWNSFTVIGLIIFLIGLVAKIKGPGFEFDAGVPPEFHEALYYMIVGAIFIVNGYIFGPPIPAETELATDPKSTEASMTAVPASPKGKTKVQTKQAQ